MKLRKVWADKIDNEIEKLNKLKVNLLDFDQRLGKELEKRGWVIRPSYFMQNIKVEKNNATKDDFFEARQLIEDVIGSCGSYFPIGNKNGKGLGRLVAIWNNPYEVQLDAFKPTGCKVEYKEITKTEIELVSVDCQEFKEES